MGKSGAKYAWSWLLVVFLAQGCVAPPTKNQPEANKTEENQDPAQLELDLEYNRYLLEVVNALESDPEFKKKMNSAKDEDFRSGKIAAELEYVNHHVRTKLDELKRTELKRLKDLVRQADELKKKPEDNHQNPGHVDHANPHTFEVHDLQKLIFKVRQDLEDADKKRKDNFKEYELQKEFEKEQKLKTLDEEHKKEYLKELEEQKQKHEKHDPLHAPGHKAQLEEVWEKQDHMENQEFNPKAFFYLHDVDGNGYWDEAEVNALFLKELDKLYQAGLPEDDMREREEEMERMREHVFQETDTNKDRLISYQEFLEQTKRKEFQEDQNWETIDQKPQFSKEEYEAFEKRRQAEIEDLINRGILQPHPPGMAPNYQYAHPGQMPSGHPNQGQYHPGSQDQFGNQYYQPHPNQMGQQVPPQYANQYPNQMQQHPNEINQMHPNQIPQHHNQMNQHPNQMNQHPNQMNQHSNQINQHLNQMPQHPNQMNQPPNQMPQHPNQIPQHPNQMPQHPNQMNQPPNQMPQHPNQMPQHPNQMNQPPNQIPQHPNQANQIPQQHPSQASQIPQHLDNQVPQNTNQIPQQQQQQVNHVSQTNEIKHNQVNQIPQNNQQNNQGQYGSNQVNPGNQPNQYQPPHQQPQKYQPHSKPANENPK